jgi:transcriptional regulator with XRE-family HTH domain
MKKNSTYVRLGGVIREIRERQNFSQESYADKIRMHRNYYGQIERGEINLTLKTLETVCKGLGVRMSEVLKLAGD